MDYIDSSSSLYDDSYMKRSEQNILYSILIDTEPKIEKPIIENRKRHPFMYPKNAIYF